jgi:predicted Zn-dependent protease
LILFFAFFYNIGLANAQPAGGRLPNLGDDPGLTVAEERRLGDRIARELYRDPDYLDDPILQEYVEGIWRPLLAAARLRGELPPELDERFAFQVFLGRDRVVNAFALPGGYLGLHCGLIAVVSSRDELAAVLGHELSHVTQRHIARLTSQQAQQTPWMVGAMILGALAASKSNHAANALLVGGQAVAQQNALNFSRDMEREADRVGFAVMAQAGFDPHGAVTMFEKLLAASRLSDSGSFPYLRSHPLSTERIADMQSRLGLQAQASTASAVSADAPATVSHGMMAARARFFTNTSADALLAWQQQARDANLSRQSAAVQAGVLYGAALAALQSRDVAGAQAVTMRLLPVVQTGASTDPLGLRLHRLLMAELALNQGQADQVVPNLAQATPQQRPETFLHARVLMATGRAAEASARLRTWVATQPRDAGAWTLLAAAYAAEGKTLHAVRADAESHLVQFDFQGAQDRLKAAQDMARQGAARGQTDHVEASIIDARLRVATALVRDMAAEGR